MSFPRYREYKDSGVKWLGEVPGHWLVTKTKHVVQFTTGWTPPTGESASYEGVNLWANISDLGPKYLLDTAKRVSDDAIAATRMSVSPKGSLLFSFKLSIGQVSFAGQDMFTNEAIATFLPSSRLSLAFAYYAFPLLLVQNAAENIYGAKLLNQELIRSASFALPSLPEQTQIAAFLDRETAKIDALVAEQRRLMALLKEKRQAVISHAVTRGLNPQAPLKPSGIEWLGDMPEHWGIGSLGYLSSIQTGSTPDRAKPEYWGGDIPWLKTGEINYERILESEERITEVGLANSAARIAEVGTLMMAMYGQGVTRGRVAILGIRAAYNQACAAITFGPKLFNEYARYFFMMAYRFIRDTGNETSQMNLGSGTIAKIKILIPPLEEQRQIVSLLQIELSVFDTLTTEAQRAIDLLQERRTALISAAVTGQIDIRGLT